ncbi:MAG: BadF/BadG/BcrA/BcrD ATPase family protein [Vicinamibacteria bacterium]
MALIVGVDAGGTKTIGVVAEESGRILNTVRGGGANLHVHGELAVEKALAHLLDELCPDERPEALCLGMAGVDRPGEDVIVKSLLRRLGFRGNAVVVNDAVIAIAAGAHDRVGVVVVAGTGSIAYGIDRHGKTARAGGLGPLLADEGSAGWIGHRALLAAVRAAEGRGESTLLRDALFSLLTVASLSDLPAMAYGGGLTRERLAELAPTVIGVAQTGDAVAARILDEASAELASAACSVVRQLDYGGLPYPLLFSGGLFTGMPSLVDIIAKKAALQGAIPRRLQRDPAEGALTMAMDLYRSRRAARS